MGLGSLRLKILDLAAHVPHERVVHGARAQHHANGERQEHGRQRHRVVEKNLHHPPPIHDVSVSHRPATQGRPLGVTATATPSATRPDTTMSSRVQPEYRWRYTCASAGASTKREPA